MTAQKTPEYQGVATHVSRIAVWRETAISGFIGNFAAAGEKNSRPAAG
jgi:hypothetical protein